MRLFGIGPLLSCVLLCLASAPTGVYAQAEPSPESRDEARAEFQAGEQAFANDDYDLALRHFRRAYELAPNDAVRFNVAVCLERMGRFREAVAEYDAAARSEQLSEATRSRAREMAERGRQRLGTLRVTGSPAGADVLVDGEPTCTLPCRVQLDPRPYRVAVRADGAQVEARATVDRGGTAELELRIPTTRAARDEAAAPVEAPVPPAPAASSGGGGPSWLTWVGAGLAAVGTAGIVGFGVHATSLHDAYVANPTPDVRDEGLLARDLANASIAFAAAGALAVVIDLIVLAVQGDEARTPVRGSAAGPRVEVAF
jgi:hypothetical protein